MLLGLARRCINITGTEATKEEVIVQCVCMIYGILYMYTVQFLYMYVYLYVYI